MCSRSPPMPSNSGWQCLSCERCHTYLYCTCTLATYLGPFVCYCMSACVPLVLVAPSYALLLVSLSRLTHISLSLSFLLPPFSCHSLPSHLPTIPASFLFAFSPTSNPCSLPLSSSCPTVLPLTLPFSLSPSLPPSFPPSLPPSLSPSPLLLLPQQNKKSIFPLCRAGSDRDTHCCSCSSHCIHESLVPVCGGDVFPRFVRRPRDLPTR